MLSPVPLK